MNNFYRIGRLLVSLLALARPHSAKPPPGPAAALVQDVKINLVNYVIVIEAGTSGSTLHGYKFSRNCTTCAVQLRENDLVKKTTPGLLSYADNPKEGAETIYELLMEAKNFVPKEERSLTPVVVQATAGLSLLLIESKMEALLREVKKVVENSPFKTISTSFGVLSSRNQGIFGWLAVNFLSDRLNTKPSKMTAALDLGGAFTRVTFPILWGKQHFPPEDVLEFDLPDHEVDIYTHSYEGLGQNTARVAILSQGNPPGETTLNSECIHPMYNGTTLTYNNRVYTVNGFRRPSGQGVDLLGCHRVVNDFLTGHNIAQPMGLSNFQLVAFSGFYHTARKAELIDDSYYEQPLEKIMTRSMEICLDLYKAIPEPFLCLDLVYVTSLLYRYGIPSDTKVHFIKDIHNHEVGWTLGLAYQVAHEIISSTVVRV